jgi:hypothetical protein
MRAARRLLFVGTCLVVSGCSDDNGAGPGNPAPCTAGVTVSVSAGTTPTFSWTPACGVIGLLVEEQAGDRWFLEATGGGFGPPVTYGTVPTGATAPGPATALLAGTTYEVILFRGTEQSPVVAALHEFTP